MISQAWVWEFVDADGLILDEPISPAFSIQFDAEEWIGQNWRGFVAAGVSIARLTYEGAQISNPLDLADALAKATLATSQRPDYA